MTYDYANGNLYVSAFRAYRANLPSAVMVSLMYLGVDALDVVIDTKSGLFVGYTFAAMLFAFAIHKTVMGHKPTSWKPLFWNPDQEELYRTFMYRSLAFVGMFLAIIIVLIPIAYVSKLDEHGAVGIGMIGFVLFGLLVYGALIAIYGTTLPASVANGDSSFPAAFRRGKSQFWFTLSRLLVGPSLYTVMYSVVFIGFSQLGLPSGIHSLDTSWSLLGGIVGFIAGVVGLFGVALTATILCKAYLRAEARPREKT